MKPIPAAWPDAPWIPAADLKLEESWSALPDELKIGDSVTRTVTVLAQGIDGSQLPPLEQPDVPGIKTYPDQPKSENTRGPDGITGIGINSTALLVTESGSFELPAIRIPWWDTETDRLRYAELPAHRLEIKATPVPNSTAEPAAPAATTSPAPSPAVRTVSSTSMWMWTTLAALLGWLATTGWLMWRMQPRRQAASEERTDSIEPRLFRELVKACEANEAANARAALTRWGQRYFGEAAPPTLQTLAGRFASEDIRQGLDELERSLFSPSGSEWSGRALVDALRQWRKNDVRRRDARPPPLAPLYRSASGTSGAAHGGV